jgi:hypothetical protein
MARAVVKQLTLTHVARSTHIVAFDAGFVGAEIYQLMSGDGQDQVHDEMMFESQLGHIRAPEFMHRTIGALAAG